MPEIIETLEELLEQAQKGEIGALAVACVVKNEQLLISKTFVSKNSWKLLAAVDILHHDMIEHCSMLTKSERNAPTP